MCLQIEAQNLSIKFPIFDKLSRSMKAQLIKGNTPASKRFFVALSEVSVKITLGDRVGLIGKNGAGKSTFLRTLAGVYRPSSGSLSVNGEITSLFDVAVGLDGDANGYENIPLLMASRGISMDRLEEIIESVESFTELGEALYRPVRTYSAGMRLRIAFAVATAKVSDVLLMDEVIGVGDASFKEKSKIRIEKMMEGSGTLLLASHSNSVLQAYCSRGLVFDKGNLVFDGEIADAIEFAK